MNRCKNLVTIGFTNIAVLDEQILRVCGTQVLGEAWGREDTEGGCTVILKRSRTLLWISKPGQIAAVELDMLSSDGEGIVLGVGWIDGDLGRLEMTWNGALSDPLSTRQSVLICILKTIFDITYERIGITFNKSIFQSKP